MKIKEELENRDYDREENKEIKSDELQRITVSREAQGALTRIVERVNDGFEGGRVNRTEMANWILLRFDERLDETEIKNIRAEYFDEVSALEAILRRAKETGKVPSELRSLLQKQMGNEENIKKKIKKGLE